MKSNEKLHKEACYLRSQGKTYSEIRKILKSNIAKSTLSYWCRGVDLPKWYEEKIEKLNNLNLTKAQRIAWAAIKIKRERYLEQTQKKAESMLGKCNEGNYKLALAMLYLGEGAKWSGHSGLMLGSSDRTIVLLYVVLLEKCYGIKPLQLKCRISYRADQNIRKLESYWSEITKIPLNNFYKTKPDPRTKGSKTKNIDYMGVCVVMCAGTKIQLELEIIAKALLSRMTKMKGL